MTFSTFSSRRRPSAPPGWNIAKSWLVKLRSAIRAMAMASPMASVAVVLAVGASPRGHASRSTLMSMKWSLNLPSCDSRRPHIATIVAPMRRMIGRMLTISVDSPLLEMAMTTSFSVTMPRSPWNASAGCRKKAGVPVLASVAAILRPTWPDLPMPVTTTRAGQLRMQLTTATNSSPIRSLSARTALPSMSNVSIAVSLILLTLFPPHAWRWTILWMARASVSRPSSLSR